MKQTKTERRLTIPSPAGTGGGALFAHSRIYLATIPLCKPKQQQLAAVLA